MELLLAFLSLLTAATGALTGVRAPEGVEAAQINVVRANTASAATVAQTVAAPRAAVRAFAEKTAEPSGRSFALAPSVPLYADRLIE